jgi:hypothetical protein
MMDRLALPSVLALALACCSEGLVAISKRRPSQRGGSWWFVLKAFEWHSVGNWNNRNNGGNLRIFSASQEINRHQITSSSQEIDFLLLR